MNNRQSKHKWFDSVWFIRVISFLCALLLFAFVASENDQFTSRRDSNTSINITETISNVPVKLGAVDDDVFVSNLQENVTVKVTGPKNIVNQVLTQKLYVTTDDLKGAEMGQQQVQLKMPSEFQENQLDYQITPTRVIVDLARIDSKEVPVTYEIDEHAVAEGYMVSQVRLKPEAVKLTGKQETIEKINRVSVKITVKDPAKQSFSGSYPIEVRDAENNLLDLNTNVDKIDATVEVVPIKEGTASIKVNPVGEMIGAFQYQYEIESPKEVTIKGNEKIIKQTPEIYALLDMSQITASGTYEGVVQLPEGIVQASQTKVRIKVTLTPLGRSNQSRAADTQPTDATSATREPQVGNQANGVTPTEPQPIQEANQENRQHDADE